MQQLAFKAAQQSFALLPWPCSQVYIYTTFLMKKLRPNSQFAAASCLKISHKLLYFLRAQFWEICNWIPALWLLLSCRICFWEGTAVNPSQESGFLFFCSDHGEIWAGFEGLGLLVFYCCSCCCRFCRPTAAWGFRSSCGSKLDDKLGCEILGWWSRGLVLQFSCTLRRL